MNTCAVETAEDAERVSKALMAHGGVATDRCRLALGAPDGAWAEVAEAAIRSLAELGSGAITISDSQVTVLPGDSVTAEELARQGETLREALPESYEVSLLDARSVSVEGAGAPQLTLSRAPDGPVMMRGPVPTAQDEAVLASVAAARFGADNLTRVISIDSELPADWALRALTATEVLAVLHEGRIDVTETLIAIRGTTQRPDGVEQINAGLAERLGPQATVTVDVAYEAPEIVVEAPGPTPEICVTEINAILLDTKITFAPGSIELDEAGQKTVDSVAEILRDCPDVAMEIGGHTDSQGREEMNQMLSQARAEAVLAALSERRVLTGQLTANGYGETQPIADNSTEAGREANRRIAFRLIDPEGAAIEE